MAQLGLRAARCTLNVVASTSSATNQPRAFPVPPTSLQNTKRTPSAVPEIVVSPTGSPAPAPPPSPVAIIHSTAYLQQTGRLVVEPFPPRASRELTAPCDPGPAPPLGAAFSSNALQWALQKADASLNEVEQNPPLVQKALYDVSRGPVGQAAAKGVEVAAKVAMDATITAAKAAAPVGRVLLQEGLKAAVGLVTYAMQQEQAQGATRQQQQVKPARQQPQQLAQPKAQPKKQQQAAQQREVRRAAASVRVGMRR